MHPIYFSGGYSVLLSSLAWRMIQEFCGFLLCLRGGGDVVKLLAICQVVVLGSGVFFFVCKSE